MPSGADYLFFRDNPKGVHLERWRHGFGCGQWFNVARAHRDATKCWRSTALGEPPPAPGRS